MGTLVRGATQAASRVFDEFLFEPLAFCPIRHEADGIVAQHGAVQGFVLPPQRPGIVFTVGDRPQGGQTGVHPDGF